MRAPITTGMCPAVLQTVISRAVASFPATSAHKLPAIANAAILDHVLMSPPQTRAPRIGGIVCTVGAAEAPARSRVAKGNPSRTRVGLGVPVQWPFYRRSDNKIAGG